MRFVALALLALLLPRIAWPCSPAPHEPHVVKGTGPRKLLLDVGQRESVLREGEKELWRQPIVTHRQFFGSGEAFVVFVPDLDDQELVLVPTRAGAAPIRANVVQALSEDERSQLTHSSCGLLWNGGMEPTPEGIKVFVSQSGQRRPTQARIEPLTFLVKPSGEVTRLSKQVPIDFRKLAEQWKGPPSAARAGVLEEILRLSETPTGQAQGGTLGPLIDRVLAAPDATEPELGMAGSMIGLLPLEEAELRATGAIKNKVAVPGVLWGLSRPQPALAAKLAEVVFDDPKQSPRARQIAVQIAGQHGTAGLVPIVRRALADKDPMVQEAAADNLNRTKCSEETAAVATQSLAAATPRAASDLLSHLQGCMRDDQTGERAKQLGAAVKGGLKLPSGPELTSLPEVYFLLAISADGQGDAASADGLARKAKEALAKQKHPYGGTEVALGAWEVLRAIRANNKTRALKAIEALEATASFERSAVCRFDVALAKNMTSPWRCPNNSASQFVKDARAHLGLPASPGKAKKK